MSTSPTPTRPLLGRRASATIAMALVTILVAACGVARPASPQPDIRFTSQSPIMSQWPSAGDYNTIATARSALHQALFKLTHWNQRAYAAGLAMRTLLTLRMLPGPCATYTSRLYDELWGLADAQPSEDWRPLKVLVRRDPPLRVVCRRLG
jgi:hypothetical protein